MPEYPKIGVASTLSSAEQQKLAKKSYPANDWLTQAPSRGLFPLKEALALEKWTDIAEGPSEPSQDIEITSVLEPKKRPPNPSRFRFEKVNDAP